MMNGVPKITDLGLAQVIRKSGVRGKSGTLIYEAPEVLQEEKIRPSSWHLVIGNRVFGIVIGPKNLWIGQRDIAAGCQNRLSLTIIAWRDKRQRVEGCGEEDANEEARGEIEFRITGGFFEWKEEQIRDWSWGIKWDEKRVKRREEKTSKSGIRNKLTKNPNE